MINRNFLEPTMYRIYRLSLLLAKRWFESIVIPCWSHFLRPVVPERDNYNGAQNLSTSKSKSPMINKELIIMSVEAIWSCHTWIGYCALVQDIALVQVLGTLSCVPSALHNNPRQVDFNLASVCFCEYVFIARNLYRRMKCLCKCRSSGPSRQALANNYRVCTVRPT